MNNSESPGRKNPTSKPVSATSTTKIPIRPVAVMMLDASSGFIRLPAGYPGATDMNGLLAVWGCHGRTTLIYYRDNSRSRVWSRGEQRAHGAPWCCGPQRKGLQQVLTSYE